MHTIAIEPAAPLLIGETARIEGEEARHASRVKRLRPGDPVRLCDGAGLVADGVFVASEGHAILVEIGEIATQDPVTPRVEVYSAVPKGDRVSTLIEQLSEVGAASWTPLRTERSVVNPRDTKLDRLRRVARESAKQCQRAWTLEVGDQTSLTEVLSEQGIGFVLADASGSGYEHGYGQLGEGNTGRIGLLIGPEGGWSEAELAQARDAGARIVSFGPHVMRIGSAAVVGAAQLVMCERMSQRE